MMKKFWKGFMTTAAALALTFGAAACRSGNDDTDQGEVDTDGNTIVSIMFHVDSKSAEGRAYQKRVDAFNAAYKDKKVKASARFIARTTGATDYETQLGNMLNEGTLPDIITFDAPNCASYANAGLLYDITSVIDDETKNDFLSLNEYQGKLYGLPIQESSAGFYYNKALFSKAGINVENYTVDNPWTFDQFKEVCKKLKDSGVSTPVNMRLNSTTDETATYLLYPFVYAAGGEFLSDDGLTATGYFNSAATQSGFQFIKDLIVSGDTSYSATDEEFFTGKSGMYLSAGWTIPDIDNKYTDAFPSRDSWGLLPYPKGTAAASATGSWSFAITDNHHTDKTYSKELLLWLTSTESSAEITNATGMIPARKSVEKNYAAGSPEYVLRQQLEKTGKARPATVGYPQFSSAFRNVIYELKDNDVASVLNNKTAALQLELDKLKKLG